MANDLILNVLLRARDQTSGQIGMLGSALGGLTNPAVLAAVAVAGIGIASVKMAADFQTQLTTLVTSAGESKDRIQQVGDGIKQMAVDTGTSTSQLVAGMYMVESAGYHAANGGLDVLRAAAMGARAENANLADVANAVTSALNAYSLKGKDATWVTNDLVAAVGAGKMHMQDLATALSNVLPVSARFHVSLQDTTAAISTMTMQGDDASSAATHLRQMILALEAPASAGAKALKSIGLTTQEVSTEMQKSLPGAIQLITDHLKKKFPEGSAAYNEALKNISGGSKQMMAMLELSGSHLQTFKNNVDQVSNAVKKGGNSIYGFADVQNTLNFKLAQAKEAIGNLLLTIGAALLPVVSKLAVAIVPIVQRISDWLTKSGILDSIIKLIQTTLNALMPVLDQLAQAIFPVVAQIINMVVNSGILQMVIGTVGQILQALMPILKALLPPILQIIQSVITWLVKSGVLKQVLDTVLTVVKDLAPPLTKLLEQILPIVAAILQFILKTGILNAVLNIVTLTIKLVAAILGFLITVITWVIDKVSHLGDMFSWLGTQARNLWNNFTTTLGNLKNLVGQKLGDIWNTISNFFTSLPGKALTWGQNMIQSFINGIKNMLGGVGNVAQQVVGTVKNFLGFHSPTKEGPGAAADQWSPAFMKMFMDGIKNNIPALRQVMSEASKELTALHANPKTAFKSVDATSALNSSGGIGTSSNSSSGITVINNITINAPNTSAQDIVKLVLKEITFQNKRRGNFVTATSGGRV